jgi:hypothetical protein
MKNIYNLVYTFMIINKPQQFIIFDCEQNGLILNNLSQDVKDRIFKIFRIQQPVGSTFQAYLPDNVFGSQFSRLESNNLYLIFTKPGQLGYEIPGAVDPEDYCGENLFKDSVLVLNSDYPLVLSNFFDQNFNTYYYKLPEDDYISLPPNVDYVILFDENVENRNFKLIENENQYPELLFQYNVSNPEPVVGESLLIDIRIVNTSNNKINANLYLKTNEFDLNFNGTLKNFILDEDQYEEFTECDGIFWPIQDAYCCPDGTAAAYQQECNLPKLLNLNIDKYCDLSLVFEVTNPPTEKIETGSPLFIAGPLSSTPITDETESFPLSFSKEIPIKTESGFKATGVIVGKKGKNGCGWTGENNCSDLQKAAEEHEKCRGEGKDAEMIIEVIPSKDGDKYTPVSGARGLFNVLFKKSGDNKVCEDVKKRLLNLLDKNGKEGSELKIGVSCDGQTTFKFNFTEDGLNSTSSALGDCNCNNSIFTARGFICNPGSGSIGGLSDGLMPSFGIYTKNILIDFNNEQIEYLIVGSAARKPEYRDIDVLYKNTDDNVNKIIQVLKKHNIIPNQIKHTIIHSLDKNLDLFSSIPLKGNKFESFKETTTINILGVNCPSINKLDAETLKKSRVYLRKP